MSTRIPPILILLPIAAAAGFGIYLGAKAGQKNKIAVVGVGLTPQLEQGVSEAILKDALEAAILA